MNPSSIGAFLRDVAQKWSKDDAATLGAALAYYTVFSLAPMLVLAVAIAGLVFGRAAAEGEIVAQIEGVIGASGATLIENMIERASTPTSGLIASAISLATMLFGASGAFGQLQRALNRIWGADLVDRTGLQRQLRRRAVSFFMILVIGLLLFVAIALSAVVSGLHSAIEAYFTVPAELLSLASIAISFTIVVALFALIFRLVPDARIKFRDVWLGAVLTAVLFTIGKSVAGIYLGRAGVTSVYGAAGSLVLVLLWVYYSAQLLFLGAEFTEVYSRRYGSRRPED